MSITCPECGGSLVQETRKIPYTYKDQTIEVDQPGSWCQKCGEGVLCLTDMKVTEQTLHDHRAIVDGLLTSQEIRRIRKKLNLTQKEAAEIFGGGANAFSRYELGETTPVRAVDNLLRLLDNHPDLLDEITNVAA